VRAVLEQAARWRADGGRVAIARVVASQGSAPREAGAAMAVRDDGTIAGSVSGGCVEGAVVTEALRSLATGRRSLVSYGWTDGEGFEVGLTCGGTVHLFIEPLDW
jgi:xanthine dehydrogenase accessory factor